MREAPCLAPIDQAQTRGHSSPQGGQGHYTPAPYRKQEGGILIFTDSILGGVSPRPASLEDVSRLARASRWARFPVDGDCLEGAGVLDGGTVVVDFARNPAPPRYGSRAGEVETDLCLCYAAFPGNPAPAIMLKEYTGVWGPWQMVGTRYSLDRQPFKLNCGFPARAILGVVIASFAPDGALLWSRDPDSFPKDLDCTPTIHGTGVSDPIPLADDTAAQTRRGRAAG